MMTEDNEIPETMNEKPENVKDPQSYITKFAFLRSMYADVCTEVNSPYEQAYLMNLIVMFEQTKVKIYYDEAIAYMRLKISKDRKSRIEAVDSLKATNQKQPPGFDSGFTVIEAIDKQEPEGG